MNLTKSENDFPFDVEPAYDPDFETYDATTEPPCDDVEYLSGLTDWQQGYVAGQVAYNRVNTEDEFIITAPVGVSFTFTVNP